MSQTMPQYDSAIYDAVKSTSLNAKTNYGVTSK